MLPNEGLLYRVRDGLPKLAAVLPQCTQNCSARLQPKAALPSVAIESTWRGSEGSAVNTATGVEEPPVVSTARPGTTTYKVRSW